jgi:flagellar basal-body rod protein FlgF
MDRLIHTALTTLRTSNHGDTVHATNMANASVPGFRRDLESASEVRLLDSENTLRSRAFTIRETKSIFSEEQGEIRFTGLTTDVAISGPGYFIIQHDGRDPHLSRRGDLRVNADNQLVDGVGAFMLNNELQPIILPPFQDISIGEDGRITITPIGAEPGEVVQAGFLGTTLAEGVALEKSIDGGIRQPDGTVPPADQQSQVLNGALETSNVNTVEELVETIRRQREYELNVKLISIARDLDEAGASIMRMAN